MRVGRLPRVLWLVSLGQNNPSRQVPRWRLATRMVTTLFPYYLAPIPVNRCQVTNATAPSRRYQFPLLPLHIDQSLSEYLLAYHLR